jgi:gliding motility-associated-like protein
MRSYLTLLLICFSMIGLAQGEANHWYFGENAGLDFTSGAPVAVINGQLNTKEGCAVLSSSAGQLLFYTNGVTVYDRNHQVMPNGTGLMGNYDTTQSATIVQKPGSTNLFYVFTLDAQAGPNGFRYSVIDLSLNGGFGDVTNQKNILVYTPTCEKIAIIKHANNIDFWVITHGFENNSFIAHTLSASGLNTNPVISNVGFAPMTNPVQPIYKAASIGYMKVSPNGKKIAVAYDRDLSVNAVLELLDFNNVNGAVSNPIQLSTGGYSYYGLEFSPNSQLLYFSNVSNGNVYQFNLQASDVAASAIPFFFSLNRLGALQLAPNGKIYIAQFDTKYLGVINQPNVIGTGCNVQYNSLYLANKNCKSGLPSFNQSIFLKPTIEYTPVCVGDNVVFNFNTNQPVTSAIWDYGDGTTSNSIIGSHTFVGSGPYTVTVNVTTPYGNATSSTNVSFNSLPTATQPTNILLCDNNNDGFATFNLNLRKPAILNGQSSSLFNVTFYASIADYNNNIPIVNPTNYVNLVAFQSQTIIAEVSNGVCKAITNFDLHLLSATTLINVPAINSCDNTSFGTTNDSKVVFDLTQNTTALLNGQSATDFSVNYYQDAALTQLIATPTAYVNTSNPQTIYVKIANNLNPACAANTSFSIEVWSLPVVNTVASLKQCDDNNDGFSAFNLNQSENQLVSNASGLTFTYFETMADATSNSNAITNTLSYTNQTVNTDVVYVRISNANGCYRVATLNLIVSTTNIPNTFQRVFTLCDDTTSGSNTDGLATFNFSSVTNDVRTLYPVGQLLNITYYKNLTDALQEQNAINNIANYTNVGYPNTQNIYVRVDSQLNNECLGLGHHVTLNVEALPIIQNQVITQCDDNQDGVFGFDTTNLQSSLLNGLTNVSLTYFDQNGSLLPSPLPNPLSTTSQIITVVATNNTANACFDTATVQFVVSKLPIANTIPVSLTTVCDDELDPVQQNGSYPFDTSSFQNTIIGNQANVQVNYFDQNNQPLSSPLPNPFNSNTQTIRYEVVNTINPNCKAGNTINFMVQLTPKINLLGTELVCSNNLSFTKVIDAGLLDTSTVNNFTYQWFLNGNALNTQTNYSLTVNAAGTYTVLVTNAQGCSKTRTITVTASNIATINNIEINDLTDNNSVIVNVTGLGNYEYSLDGITYQNSNSFFNVPSGNYTIYVNDIDGCGLAKQDISLLGIPNYFTPNQDGYNDNWNIQGVGTNQDASVVSIFDRYGKLLKQISVKSNGWDGTFNGVPMPSSDYWYVINLEDGRVFKGHFALKR